MDEGSALLAEMSAPAREDAGTVGPDLKPRPRALRGGGGKNKRGGV